MILETVYGGWLNKRDSLKDKFKQRRLLPSSQVPRTYFGVIVSGLCDENRNFT